LPVGIVSNISSYPGMILSNTQKIKEILVDCDSDAIIYLVEPSGPACHTGEKVCFHNELK